MDSQLAVMSTTNHLYNTSLYDTLTPESLVRAPVYTQGNSTICGC